MASHIDAVRHDRRSPPTPPARPVTAETADVPKAPQVIRRSARATPRRLAIGEGPEIARRENSPMSHALRSMSRCCGTRSRPATRIRRRRVSRVTRWAITPNPAAARWIAPSGPAAGGCQKVARGGDRSVAQGCAHRAPDPRDSVSRHRRPPNPRQAGTPRAGLPVSSGSTETRLPRIRRPAFGEGVRIADPSRAGVRRSRKRGVDRRPARSSVAGRFGDLRSLITCRPRTERSPRRSRRHGKVEADQAGCHKIGSSEPVPGAQTDGDDGGHQHVCERHDDGKRGVAGTNATSEPIKARTKRPPVSNVSSASVFSEPATRAVPWFGYCRKAETSVGRT